MIENYNIFNFNMVIASTALISAGIVWVSFNFKWLKENIKEPKKILKAIRKELELVGSWARGSYPDSSKEDYKKRKEYNNFYNPSRMVFKFEFPTIKSITDKNLIHYFKDDFIEKLISLKQAILNFQQFNERLNKVAMTYPDIYLSVLRKLDRDRGCVILKNYKEKEQEYMKMIYDYNYKLHHGLIGGDWNKNGLHIKYIEALHALEQERLEYNKRFNKPFWYYYYLGQGVAFLFVTLGLILLIHFLSIYVI